jgi:hypothetical protein
VIALQMTENVMAQIKTQGRGGVRKNAGRKPQAVKKSAYFSTRLDEATRERLERDAAEGGVSLSEEIQRRLKDSLNEKNDWGQPHVRSLARLIMHLAERVDMITHRTWSEDQFAFEALKRAIDISFEWLDPKGEVVMPAHLEATLKYAPAMATPDGVAATVALGLREQMMMDEPSGRVEPNVRTAKEVYGLPRLGAKLFSKREGEK